MNNRKEVKGKVREMEIKLEGAKEKTLEKLSKEAGRL